MWEGGEWKQKYVCFKKKEEINRIYSLVQYPSRAISSEIVLMWKTMTEPLTQWHPAQTSLRELWRLSNNSYIKKKKKWRLAAGGYKIVDNMFVYGQIGNFVQ